jgi:putative transposase
MSPHRSVHLKTFDYVGLHRYSLTFCTHKRRRLFIDKGAVDLVLHQIVRAAEDDRFALIAYCFMPDHVHLLIEGQSDDSDCLRFIRRAKQFGGYQYAKRFKQQLWQRYGFERTLRNGESTMTVARYIFENPLRAGLVQKPEDDQFSGSRTHTLSELLEATGERGGRSDQSGSDNASPDTAGSG